jgi:predicted TIM-barrel fold metal-dependent hydrolase
MTMAVPRDIGVIDTMMGLPGGDKRWWAKSMAPLLLDAESRSQFQHAASYMFKDLPDDGSAEDPVATLLGEMDRHNIEKALVGVSFHDEASLRALREHPDRIMGTFMVDPNQGMDAVRELTRAVTDLGVIAANFFPCGCVPQVPIDDKKVYPIYAKCVELDIPIFVNAGVPGPRVPMEAQNVARVDEVCWFFPELRLVLRHGAEPWADLAVKLMIKWPNLYYSTSAFAPRYYPQAIVDFANTSRGADRIMYAGYYPSGLSLDRIFTELEDLDLKPAVWPKFLRDNAATVLGLSKPAKPAEPAEPAPAAG